MKKIKVKRINAILVFNKKDLFLLDSDTYSDNHENDYFIEFVNKDQLTKTELKHFKDVNLDNLHFKVLASSIQLDNIVTNNGLPVLAETIPVLNNVIMSNFAHLYNIVLAIDLYIYQIEIFDTLYYCIETEYGDEKRLQQITHSLI